VDVRRALEIEAEIHHDLMAELKAFAEQAPLGVSILHLGATSMDIEDNADVLRARQSLELAIQQCRAGNRLMDVSRAIQTHVEGQGFSVVRSFVGRPKAIRPHDLQARVRTWLRSIGGGARGNNAYDYSSSTTSSGSSSPSP